MTDAPTIGHNSAAGRELLNYIERIERVEEERAELAGDVRDIYAELKSKGYDPKITRKVVRLRKMDAAKRAEEQAITETYLAACGML